MIPNKNPIKFTNNDLPYSLNKEEENSDTNYMKIIEAYETLDDDDKHKIIKFIKKDRKKAIVDELLFLISSFDTLRLLKYLYQKPKSITQFIKSGDPSIDHEIVSQLEKLDFFKINKNLSANELTWFELINFFSNFLVTSYQDRYILRNKAQYWSDERKNMHPLIAFFLRGNFGNRFHDESRVSDGYVDHRIDNIPIEDKLLKRSKYQDVEKVLDEIFNDNIDQLNRYSGISGFEIICVVDIRKEVKSNKFKNYPLKKCVKIFHKNHCWYALYLIQAFTKPPSRIKIKYK